MRSKKSSTSAESLEETRETSGSNVILSESSGSDVIPRRARPGLAGLMGKRDLKALGLTVLQWERPSFIEICVQCDYARLSAVHEPMIEN